MAQKRIQWETFLYDNRKLLLGVSGFIILVSISWQSFQFYKEQSDKKIEKALYLLKQDLQQAEEKEGGHFFKKNLSFFEKIKSKKQKKVFKEVKNYKKFLLSATFINEIHLAHALELAQFLVHYGQEAEAVEILEPIFHKARSRSWVYNLIALKLSSLWMNQNKYKQVIFLLEPLLLNKEMKPFKVDALLKIALSYEALLKNSDAKKIYNSLLKDKDISETDKERAKGYYRLLLLKEKRQAQS